MEELDSCFEQQLGGSWEWQEALAKSPGPSGAARLSPGPLGEPGALMTVPFRVFHQAYRECVP